MIELDLRDIHLPDGVTWWPPGPGWWMLALVLTLLATLLWWYWRRHRNPLKLASLQELSRLRAAHANGAAETCTVAQVSTLMRRIAISRLGRAQVAGITGDAWRGCLEELSIDCEFNRDQLDLLTYQRFQRNPDCDVDGLLRACEKWVHGLPREGEHVST